MGHHHNDLDVIKGRLDGKTCLVTGANSGLGKAMAIELARRGANVIMGCRREYHDELAEIQAASGNDKVSLRVVDLASFDSVDRFCRQLGDEKVNLDVVMCNAGMAAGGDLVTHDGIPLILQVNCFSYARMIRNFLAMGIIRQDLHCVDKPRIIFTSSTRHRGAPSIDLDHFGVMPRPRFGDVFKVYGLSKLYLMNYAWELGKRLMVENQPLVSVFAFCPGPFRSRIGEDLGFLGKIAMSSLPVSPQKAAWLAIYLACSPEMDGKTLVYYHKRKQEEPDRRVTDPACGARIWEMTNQLLDRTGGRSG